ncbi:hypothetical protein Y032_0113g357 [Ancylostoma ceylanicum]|uniref:Uncharacterized protein n=1 Tax=Ancylostoma ceylanicum TaxID=53326 RepID=A0A016TCL5_9BILA|nr:hypothetical protein Y032_0113g357 [Ancylostoma ceylanicum]
MTPVDCRVYREGASNLSICPLHAIQYVLSVGETRRASYRSLKDFVKKSDHRVGGLPVVRFTFRGVQSLTALVQRWSFWRITCPAHLILLGLAYTAASLIFDCRRRVEMV